MTTTTTTIDTVPFHKTIVTPSQGLDQLDCEIGKPVAGDWVKIQFEAHNRTDHNNNNNKANKIYNPSFHWKQQTAQFQLGTLHTDADDVPLPPAVCKAVATMNLGEVAFITGTLLERINMDGTKANEGSGGETTLQAGAIIETRVQLLKLGRNGKWHNYKLPVDDSSLCTQCLYQCFRFNDYQSN